MVSRATNRSMLRPSMPSSPVSSIGSSWNQQLFFCVMKLKGTRLASNLEGCRHTTHPLMSPLRLHLRGQTTVGSVPSEICKTPFCAPIVPPKLLPNSFKGFEIWGNVLLQIQTPQMQPPILCQLLLCCPNDENNKRVRDPVS